MASRCSGGYFSLFLFLFYKELSIIEYCKLFTKEKTNMKVIASVGVLFFIHFLCTCDFIIENKFIQCIPCP